MSVVVALLLLAGWLLAPAGSHRRRAAAAGTRTRAWPDKVPLPTVAVVAAAGTAVLVGGWFGLLLAGVVAAGVLLLVPRLESRTTRRRRAAMAAQAPELLDLLAACLGAGADLPAAVSAVADAVAEPAAGVLRRVHTELRLGAGPEAAWASAAAEPALASLAAAVARASDSGVGLAQSLPLLADDVRARRRAQVQAAVSRVGVRLTAPLGLAFLPAFVLLGVVPVVAALATAMLTGP
ncbi:MAG TPA: type II secretion system F family protein [Candidatus Nanopelagicales bacterium]|nr:type II secretion system F family protein [Candidatus Nanopelagicales bacterium]